MSEFKYWAFLSYSHTDKEWGDWLHKALETYRVPRRLVGKDSRDGKVPQRVFPIFRDREELPVSADLGSNINQALSESRYLIVICSPRSAQSRWVGEEIKTYKKLGREGHILALIIDGEPNASDGKAGFEPEDECFPEPMRFQIGADGTLSPQRTEPIAADAREGKDGKENAKLKLLAGLLGVNYDDLRQREQERRIRRLRAIVAVTLALVSGFGVLSVYAWNQKRAAESALAQTRKTLSQSDFLQALRAIGENRVPDALAQLARSLVLDPGNEAALGRLATLLTYGGFDIPVLRFKHHDAVLFAQFSPDGKKIVTASRDGTAVVWDAESGKALTPALKHEQIVWFAEFSPDSARILTVSDQAARIWDVPSGKLVTEPLKQKLITSAQFSPDGTRVVTTAADHEARIWDARTGQSTEPLKHDGPVLSAQFSPDGTRIATSSADKTARIWDAQSSKPLTPPLQHSGEVVSVRFSPDGRRLVTASRDWSARIWDAQNGKLQIDIMDNRDLDFAQFTADGTRIVTKSADREVNIWDAQSGKALTAPLHHEYVIASVALSPDGTKIVTAGGHDNTIRVWSVQTGRLLFDPLKHDSGVLSARFSPDGKRIVSASWDCTARIWNLQTGHALTQPLRHEFAVDAAEFAPDGKRILTRSLNAVRIWDAQTSELLSKLEESAVLDTARFTSDGKNILSVSDGTARTWDAQNGKTLAEPLKFSDTMAVAQFSPDGKRIVTGTQDYVSLENTAMVWDVQARKLLVQGLKIVDALNWACFSGDGKRIVTASGNAARIWDAENGRLLAGPMKHQGKIVWSQFDPADRRIVTISGNEARIWDEQSGNLLLELKSDGPINPPQFSPDGKWILTASMDHTARLWDAQSGKPIAQPMKHDKPVNSAQFSPDGKWIVTASNDHTARIWDARSGTPLTDSLKHDNDVESARFSPDGRQIITASKDTTARIWDFLPVSKRTPKWLPRLAEAVAGEQLNDQGVFEPSDADPSEVLKQVREQLARTTDHDDWATWGRWFLADRTTRTISPFSKLTIPEYIENRIKEGTLQSLDEAERLAFGRSAILKRIEQARAALESRNPPTNPNPPDQ